jgi:hypothetical protein
MFSTEQDPADGISAVKLMGLAQSAGQRIYDINSNNYQSILPNLYHDNETLIEIQNAIYVGKRVITHTYPIQTPAWTSSGYIIIDMETGNGAYKIGGGFNGGEQGFDVFIDSLLEVSFPVCEGTYLERLGENYLNVNTAIPGLLLPLGTGLITQFILARILKTWGPLAGFISALLTGNPGYFAVGLFTSLVHFFTVALSFQVGIAIGSGIKAVMCRSK